VDKGRICIYCGVSNPVQGLRCRGCGSRLDSNEVNVEIFENAWEYAVLRKTFRSGGGWSIFWGIIAILMGVGLSSQSSLNFLLVPIGFFLLITGIAGRGNLSVGVIVGDGLALLLIGIWNIGITIMNATDGYQPSFWGVLGVMQILWGIRRLILIPCFQKIAVVPIPIVDHVERLVNFVQEIQSNNEKMIELQANGNRWRTLFTPEMVLLATDKAKKVRFVPRIQFSLNILEDPQPRKPGMISIHLGKETWSGSISADNIKRYDKLVSLLEINAPVAKAEEFAPSGKSPVTIFTSCCSRCKQERIPGDQYCRACGLKYEDPRFCSNCSQELISGDRFCRRCGAEITHRNVTQQQSTPAIKV